MQVIEAHDVCLARILRFSLIERLRPLTAFGIINRACGQFCDAADRCITAAGATPGRAALNEAQLLELAGDGSFRKAVSDSSASFDKVRAACASVHIPCDVLLLLECQARQHMLSVVFKDE